MKQGESLAAKLGLVGVGEGTQFTLRGLSQVRERWFGLWLVADLTVEAVEKAFKGYNNSAVIGANRDKITVRPEYNGYMFQRSTSDRVNFLENESLR